MEIKEKVNHLMETAEFEPVVCFDRCLVLMAQLESGEILLEATASQTAEEFTTEKAVETCMMSLYERLTAVVSAQMAEPAEPILNEEQAKIIVALADHNLNATEVAKVLGYGRSTMQSRINKIRKDTGKDPLTFYGMAQLLMEARQVLEG